MRTFQCNLAFGLFVTWRRAKDSVKHFHVTRKDRGYVFGFNEFSTLHDFVNHFANQPLLGSDTGMQDFRSHPTSILPFTAFFFLTYVHFPHLRHIPVSTNRDISVDLQLKHWVISCLSLTKRNHIYTFLILGNIANSSEICSEWKHLINVFRQSVQQLHFWTSCGRLFKRKNANRKSCTTVRLLTWFSDICRMLTVSSLSEAGRTLQFKSVERLSFSDLFQNIRWN